MTTLTSGGFMERSAKTEQFVSAVEGTVLTQTRYLNVRTGIEDRFGKDATHIHGLLYNSLGPTTDLLRYFPDDLYFDRKCLKPSWDKTAAFPKILPAAAKEDATGLFSFFVEYKYSYTPRPTPIGEVPTKYIGIVEREAWLTYKRLTHENQIPNPSHYLNGQRTLIALFYAATYAPHFLYAQWEHLIVPIAIQDRIAKPGAKSNSGSKGSGTPFINFDLRTFKPLELFLAQDLFWDVSEAAEAVKRCKAALRTPA